MFVFYCRVNFLFLLHLEILKLIQLLRLRIWYCLIDFTVFFVFLLSVVTCFSFYYIDELIILNSVFVWCSFFLETRFFAIGNFGEQL